MEQLLSTTVLIVKRANEIAIAGDGQVTLGNFVMKSGAKKIRKLYNDSVLAGFAGSVSDAISLFDKFELKLEEYRGNLKRAAVELAKEWRSNKLYRNLNAMLVAASKDDLLIISGTGDVIEPDNMIAAIGSGSQYAYAAATALYTHTDFSPEKIAYESLNIAGKICIYTNTNISIETIKF